MSLSVDNLDILFLRRPDFLKPHVQSYLPTNPDLKLSVPEL